jgi:hypothetical protein
MSGSSRAITLSLSVRDADVVRTQLLQMGEAGEQALTRLDAAAKRATGGGGGLPQISTGAQTATRDFGSMREAVGSAGYQLQDFAVQVQGGTSALTALSQQGSQFLGVFGPAGAVAGAALTVGILAYQLVVGKDNAAELAKVADEGFRNTGRVAEDLAKIIERVNELFLTQGERATMATNATRAQLLEQLRFQQSTAIQMQEGSAMELPTARREMEREERRLAAITARNERLRRSGGNVPVDEEDEARARVFTSRSRIQGLEADLNRQSSRIGQIAEAMRRAENSGVDRGNGEYGPERPTVTRGGGGRAPSDSQGVNALEAIERSPWAQAQRDLNAYNQELNLNAANLSGAASALSAYERNMATLNAALANNVITEQQYSQEVEASSVRLAEQIEQIERRGQQAGTMGRELGMTFSSAFEDAILKGKSFREVLEGIIQDLARIVLRQTVTTPLASAISAGVGNFSFSNLFGGGGGVSPVPTTGGISLNPFGFANGGIMTGSGPVPLRRYAGGGIANSPQLAMFGEGSTPEAYVPLPDGRRIPVAMEGGGGMTFAPTYNIDARGSDASMIPRLRAEMVAIARASNAELLDNIQRGGSAARIVGRRA